ncbi:MAG: hypothetical protein ACYDCQ_01445 [Dehalococcoidia bacterium]
MSEEYRALKDHATREDTVYRRADLLGPIDSELRQEAIRRRGAARRPLRWVGSGLIAAGQLLTALGERLASSYHEARSPNQPNQPTA